MKRVLFVFLALVLTAGLFGGCKSSSSDEPSNPFKGTWRVPAYGVTVVIGDDTWTIQGIGTGSFSYQGDYPDYVVTIGFGGQPASGTAHFNDKDQFRACFQGDCANFNKQ